MTSESELRGRVGLGHQDSPRRYLGLILEPGSAVEIVVPAIRDDARRWLLDLELPGHGRLSLCLRGRNRSAA